MNRTAWLAIVLLTLLGAGTEAAATEPAELLKQIRAPVLDPAGAVSIRNHIVELGPARFAVDRGVLIPARIADGRAVELVFIGHAHFQMEPPDEIEAGQLELFTGEQSLDVDVEEAVLVLTSENTLSELLDRPPPRQLRPELIERAQQIHDQWLIGTERRTPGIAAAVFKSLVGDRAFENYFAVWCHGFEHGDVLYRLDPEHVEQITVASFHPLEMSNWERRRLKHQIRIQRRKGRWLDLRVADVGAWDIWVSTPWDPADGNPTPGTEGFEAEHYELDVAIKRGSKRLEGQARLDLTAVANGRRVVRLALLADLTVDRVLDGDGQEMFFFRSGEAVSVLLPRESRIGERLTLEVFYGGKAIHWVGKKTYDLTDTGIWYPHCGTVDRATYDVTLRWPEKYQLISSGRRVDGGRKGNYLWERRRLDLPSIAFSFVLGDYVVETRQVGHVEVRMAFQRTPWLKLYPVVRERTLDTVARALTYFERTFGPYPLDHLTLVTVPRAFSQSYMSFVALAASSMGFDDPLGDASAWKRDTTIAHELAHQWWGNQVGWWSYRDQWLSEGMANYSALLYDGHVAGAGDGYLSVMSAGWRDSLSQRTVEGRTIESLGPITLGNRLNSSRASNGYGAIVYRKGAVVLAMLSRAVGEQVFQQMLRSLAEKASNQVLTTDVFVQSIERMSGLDLTGFARRFIYGTGIPQVYYSHELNRDDEGRWTLDGEARLLSTPDYRLRIMRRPAGHWDLVQEPRPVSDAVPSTLMVPFRVMLEAPDQEPYTGTETPRAAGYQEGQLSLEGAHDRFRIETGARPVSLQLDPRGEILARFYSDERDPKRFLRMTAQDLAVEGKLAEAELRYREALGAPERPGARPDPGLPLLARRTRGPTENSRIRLALVRLYLEQDRDAEAEAELDTIDASLGEQFEQLFRVERTALRSRLDIQHGDYASARRRLKKMLRIADRPQGSGSWRNMLWQLQLKSERRAMTEAYSLLAIAAHELGKADEVSWSIEEARDRGVDTSLLD